MTYQALDVEEIIRSVGDDGAGATAVFIGTTRNSFKGKAGSYYARVSIEFTFNREGCHSARLPSVQQTRHQDHGRHPPLHPQRVLPLRSPGVTA